VLALLGVFFFVAWRWRPQGRFTDAEEAAASNASPTD
jgi:hypothetical protein